MRKVYVVVLILLLMSCSQTPKVVTVRELDTLRVVELERRLKGLEAENAELKGELEEYWVDDILSGLIIETEYFVVESGDCLWKISEGWFGNGFMWREIYYLNKLKIDNPDLIYPGQRFELPLRE